MPFKFAEVLLKRAVEEDPEFASAYNHLAHSLRNQGRPLEELIPYARRALEPSKQLPERERYFIEGSYVFFLGEYDQAITSYEALLQLHPDHLLANTKMFISLSREGRFGDAVPYMVRRAEQLPHNFLAAWNAGHSLASSGDDPAKAAPYFARATELVPPLSGSSKQCAKRCANWSQQAQTERNQKYRKSPIFRTQAN